MEQASVCPEGIEHYKEVLKTIEVNRKIAVLGGEANVSVDLGSQSLLCYWQ